MSAYYNEFDPYAAQWLRNLIAAGHIADGVVDERSIEDVKPDDLRTHTQCHFFAGIGGWSLALRLAGWPDDQRVWTGSCPCQPFSAAGQGAGMSDERHLWPAWYYLIGQCEPDIVFGEQVDAAIRHAWLDLVSSDLEGIGYAFGAAGLPAASVGAPHIRQRLWFVAESDSRQRDRVAIGEGRESNSVVGNADDERLQERIGGGRVPVESVDRNSGKAVVGTGFWSLAELILCSDGKTRPVEPGIFPLAHGVPGRVGRLRAYGNAIVPQVAAEWIKIVMEYRP